MLSAEMISQQIQYVQLKFQISRSGVGNLFTLLLVSRAAWIVHHRWWAAKSIGFILKLYVFLTMRKTSFDSLFKYLLITELRFEAVLYSNLGNENSDADHIKCSHRPQVSHA